MISDGIFVSKTTGEEFIAEGLPGHMAAGSPVLWYCFQEYEGDSDSI